MNSMEKYSFIQFKCSYPTQPNEELYVVGNIPELGNWDVKKAEKMTNHKDLVYKATKNLKVKQEVEIQYRYILYQNGSFKGWEEGLKEFENRKINPKNYYMIIVNDKKGVIKSEVQHFLSGSMVMGGNDEDEDSVSPFEPHIESNIKEDIRANLRSSDIVARRNSLHYLLAKPFLRNSSSYSLINNDYNDLWHSSDDEDEPATHSDNKPSEVKTLNIHDKIIIASAYLPVEVSKDEKNNWIIEPSSDTLYQTIHQVSKQYPNCIWVGFLKTYYLIPKDEREIVENLLKKKGLFCISLSEEKLRDYQEFMKVIFINLFQYYAIFKDLYSIKSYETLWQAYKEFNDSVAKTIVSHLTDDTLILLHDYNLLLTPSYVHHNIKISNASISNISIGLFMHRPFPGSDVFRRFPHREDIMNSIMNCSSIFFHTYEATRNFITNCKRSSNITFESTRNGDLAISYFGRNVIINVRQLTSDIPFLREEMKKKEFEELRKQIKAKHKDKFIFVSIDLIYNNFFCIRNKLEGYINFLRENGSKCEEENVLIQYYYVDEEYIFSKGNKERTDAIRNEINQYVTRIHKEFSPGVIEVIEKKLSYTERLAVLSAGNCYIRASLRLGFTLDIYDFLNLKILNGGKEELSYIFSEAIGTLCNISGYVHISPFDTNSISQGFQSAYQNHFDGGKLDPAQEKDLAHAQRTNALEWFNSVFKKIKEDHGFEDYYMGVDIGLNFKLMKMSSSFKRTDKEKIVSDYTKAKNVLFLIDFEGTLPQSKYYLEYETKGAKPHEKTLDILEQLCEDKKNTFFIVTGREKKLVEAWFQSVKGIGLAPEYGFVYTYKNDGIWHSMLKDYNNSWIVYVAEMLESYKERCEGSTIEVKESSIVWQYRDCDPELGRSFANVIKTDLESILSKYQLNVIIGKGYTEIKPKGLNKGGFCSFIVRDLLRKNTTPDLIICIGDDTSDEEMFRYFKTKKKAISDHIPDVKIHCITVGKKPSKASCYLDTQWEVNSLLEMIVNSMKKKKNEEKEKAGFELIGPPKEKMKSNPEGLYSFHNLLGKSVAKDDQFTTCSHSQVSENKAQEK